MKDCIEIFLKFIGAMSDLSVIGGIIFVVIEYLRNKQRDKEEKDNEIRINEYRAFDEMDEKFISYQKLCLENVDLNVFDVPNEKESTDEKAAKKEQIIFTILISIFERAFLMYFAQQSELRKRQWVGWDKYIDNFIGRENFIKAWGDGKDNFDAKFEEYLNKKIKTR